MSHTRVSDRETEAGAQEQTDSSSSAPRLESGSQAQRVLVLASTLPKSRRDSTPAFVLHLCRELSRRFNVTILAPAVPGAPDRDDVDGVEINRFHYFWPRSLERLADGAILENVRRNRWQVALAPLLLLFELVAAFRLARRWRPSVIHAHWFIPQGLVATVVGRMLSIPVVVTSHGGDIYGLRGRFWGAFRRAIASRCAAVTVVSRDMAVAADLRTANGARQAVLPMGVDAESFHPDRQDEALRASLSPDGPLILFVGRLSEKKGVRYLIEAMPQVLEPYPAATLAIAGDGPLRRELEKLARRLNVAEHVKFLGGVAHDELPRYYASADVFVGPSVVARGGDTEAFGVVFAEAMAAGTPVVASDVGGVGDIVLPGWTGLLAPPGSSAALAGAIRELLSSPERVRRMGEFARRWIERGFDWRTVGSNYAALLSAAMRPPRTGDVSSGQVGARAGSD